MKKLLLAALLAGVFVFAGCGGEGKDSSGGGDVKTKTAGDSLKTKKGIENKLDETGFSIYPGAEFKKLGDDEGKIVYSVPEVTEKERKKVKAFYSEVFENMKKRGWEPVLGEMEYNPQFDYFYGKGDNTIMFKQSYFTEYGMKIHDLYITVSSE